MAAFYWQHKAIRSTLISLAALIAVLAAVGVAHAARNDRINDLIVDGLTSLGGGLEFQGAQSITTTSGELSFDTDDGSFIVSEDPVNIKANFMQLTERTAPGSAGANNARLFAKDNGSGKTQLCVKFSSGASQCFATEP